MFIQTEETPNPATLKFLPGQTVLGTGTANFSEGDNTESSPLAKKAVWRRRCSWSLSGKRLYHNY